MSINDKVKFGSTWGTTARSGVEMAITLAGMLSEDQKMGVPKDISQLSKNDLKIVYCCFFCCF